MGKAEKSFNDFIDSISDSKLQSFPGSSQSNYVHNDDWRLDMQGITTNAPKRYNLQIQPNNQAKLTSVRKLNNSTVSTVLLKVGFASTPSQIKAAFKSGWIGKKINLD